MKNKELYKKICLIREPIVKETFIGAYKKMNNTERQKLGKMLDTFEYTLKNDLNFKAKAIAAYVRYNMEDFHAEGNLSNDQMKVLNPIIRNAIYTFLQDESDGNTFAISSVCNFNLPPYWEDCENMYKKT